MNITEALISYVTNNDGKNYVYIAKESKNLNTVRDTIIESCDLQSTSTKITLVHPIGVAKIIVPMDGVYMDEGCSTEEFVRQWLLFADGAFFSLINPETLEIIVNE